MAGSHARARLWLGPCLLFFPPSLVALGLDPRSRDRGRPGVTVAITAAVMVAGAVELQASFPSGKGHVPSMSRFPGKKS